jgi:protein-S-isoprenylcysteine O-methyltransferase Ste14
MKPLAYVSPYSWLFWAVFLLTYVPEFRIVARSRPQPGSADRGSMAVILVAGWIAFPIAFIVAGSGRFTLAPQRTWFFIGLALLLSGSLLRRYCWRLLGRYFTGNVQVQDGQTVIQAGPYRWVRHPSYTGGLLMYLGTGLALTNWMSALTLFSISGVGYLYRVHVEEKALMEGLGESYRQYMQRTKRFVPFVI